MSHEAVETADETEISEPTVKSRPKGRWRRAFTYEFGGVAVAFCFAWLSFTPSLIPRSGLFQGLVAGVAAVIGYVVGLAVVWTVRQFTQRSLSASGWHRAWLILWIIGGIGTVVAVVMGQVWQAELRDLVGLEDQGLPAYGVAVLLAIVVFVLLVGIGRGIRRAYRWLMRMLEKILPVKIAKGLAFVVVALLLISFVSDVVVANTLSALDSVFATSNRESYPDTGEPTAATVSGGPASGVTWHRWGVPAVISSLARRPRTRSRHTRASRRWIQFAHMPGSARATILANVRR